MEKYGLLGDNVKFITYSALGKMDDEKLKGYNSPAIVMIDEMHRAGAKTWESGLRKMFELFPDDCKYVGFSATPIRFLDGRRDMCKELFNGCVANEIGLADAILNRILPLPRYIAGLYSYDSEFNAINKKIMQSCNSEEEKKELLEEVKTMKNNLDKSTGISDIFKKYIEGNKGKYVAFCRNISHLKLMKPCLEKWFSEAGIKVNLYEVHCKNPEKDKEFKSFMDDDSLSVCLSVGILSEGIHGIDGVILLRDTISPNLYYQQIGRAFAVDMDTVPIIFDLVANCESIMNCNLKNDLLEAVDKRSMDKAHEDACVNDGQNSEKINNFNDCSKKEITRDDIESFFVFDQIIDAINVFRNIEQKLTVDWDTMFQKYCKFYEENGHGDVPYGNGYEKLFDWCYRQRKDLHSNALESNRKKRLDEKGFIWSIHKYRFLCRMKDVKSFLTENGHYPNSEDVYNDKKLGYFVENERNHKREADYAGETYPQWKLEIIDKLGLYDFFRNERKISDLVIGKPFGYVPSIEQKIKQIG